MASLNKVLLIGNLTRQPELRYTPGGQPIAKLGMAVNRKYKDASGAQKEEVTFVDVSVFGKQAEACSQYLTKGSPAFIEGRLHYNKWEGQDGQTRTKLDVTAERVQFLGRKGDGAGRSAETSAEGEPVPAAASASESDLPPDDDVPF